MRFRLILLVCVLAAICAAVPGCGKGVPLVQESPVTTGTTPPVNSTTAASQESQTDTATVSPQPISSATWWLDPQTYFNVEDSFGEAIDTYNASVLEDWNFWCSSFPDMPGYMYHSYDNVRQRIAEAHERGCRVDVAASILDVFYSGYEPGEDNPFDYSHVKAAVEGAAYDGSAIDLDGNHMQYEHPPAFIGCTNQPAWQEFLVTRMNDIVDIGYDGIIIDDFEGCSRWVTNTYLGWAGQYESPGGCFCDGCEAGFRAYLAEKYSTAELAELGVDDIDSFDYSDFLIERGWTQETLGEEAAKFYDWEYGLPETIVPLYQDYYDFEIGAVVASIPPLMETVSDYARETYGKELAWSVLMGEDSYFTHYYFDIFNRNVGAIMKFSYPPGGSESYLYRLGYNIFNGPRVRNTLYDVPWVAIINEYQADTLLVLKQAEAFINQGSWISYAYIATEGATEEAMAAGFRPDPAVISRYNSFFLENAGLFDFQKLETAAEAAVIYSTASVHYGIDAHNASFQGICEILNTLHVQYDPIIAGDGLATPDRLTADRLSTYQVVFLPNTLALTDAQAEQLLAYVEQGGTVVALGEVGRLNEYGQDMGNPQLAQLLAQPYSRYGEGDFYTQREDMFTADTIIDEEGSIHDIAMAYSLFYTAYNEDAAAILETFGEEPGEHISEATANSIRAEIRDIVDTAVAEPMVTAALPPTMNVQVYRNPETGALIAHLLNYDYELSTDTVNAQEDITISLRLPEGFAPDSVTVMSPENPELVEVAFFVEGNRISFIVPALYIWDVIVIE